MKRLWWLIRKLWWQVGRYRALWELPIYLSVDVGGFIWLFWEKLRMMDQDAVRNLILLTAGIVGWYFLYRRTKAAEEDAESARKNATTAEQGLNVDRLARAIEQLAHEKSSIRLGGILSLEQITEIGMEEQYKIIQILSAFVRDFAQEDGNTKTIKERDMRSDIEEAVIVLAANAQIIGGDYKTRFCNLQFTDLSGLSLSYVDFSYFNLIGSNFSNSLLYGIDFTGARLGKVNFSRVDCSNLKGLTQEQLEQAFYWKGNPPIDFPGELRLMEKDPNQEKPG